MNNTIYFLLVTFFSSSFICLSSKTNDIDTSIGRLGKDYAIEAALGNTFPSIMIRQASMVFTVFNKFIDIMNPGFELNILTGDDLIDKNGQSNVAKYFRKSKTHEIEHAKNSFKKVFDHFGSDKANKAHQYHGLYVRVLHELGIHKPLTILEVGMGTNNTKLVSNMGSSGKPGASLH